MPWRTSRDRALPNLVVKRKPPIIAAMASFSALEHMLMDMSAWARSMAEGLGEVHHVDGALPGAEHLLERLVKRRHPVGVDEGDGTLGVLDDRGLPAGAAGEVVLEHRDVAERGRHQDELHIG
ncbi:hypothetical protein GCM10020219_088530 [Nonomuraea dietziae]